LPAGAVCSHTPEPRAVADQVIAEFDAAEVWGAPIVAELAPSPAFYPARTSSSRDEAPRGSANLWMRVDVDVGFGLTRARPGLGAGCIGSGVQGVPALGGAPDREQSIA
jgi:hypothetical protein